MNRFGKYADKLVTFIMGVALIAVYKSFDNFYYIGSFFGKIMSALNPFIVGFAIAYFLNIPVRKILSLVDRINKRIYPGLGADKAPAENPPPESGSDTDSAEDAVYEKKTTFSERYSNIHIPNMSEIVDGVTEIKDKISDKLSDIPLIYTAPEKKLPFTVKHRKSIAIFTVYIISVLIITVTARLLFPPVLNNIIDLGQSLPVYMEKAAVYMKSFHIGNYRPEINIDINQLLEKINIEKFFSNIDMDSVSKYIQSVAGATSNVINIFIGIIVSIYMLLGKDAISRGLKRTIHALFGKKIAGKILHYSAELNDTFSKFIYCRVVDALIVAVAASVILAVMRVKYGIALGAVIGVLNLIPYFGSIISSIIAVAITILTGGIVKAIWVAAALIVLQQIDGNVIGPKLMGKSLEISPLLIIFSVTVGGGLFGVAGMLLSVPIVAVLVRTLKDVIAETEARRIKKLRAEKSSADSGDETCSEAESAKEV